MAERFERLARPSTDLEVSGVSSPQGINRNHLTLYLSIAALVLSLGGIAVQGFIFFAADWAKKSAETKLLQVQTRKEEALAQAALLEVELKHQLIKTGAAQEQDALASKVNHIAAARNNDQDTAKKRGETQTANAKGYLDDEVIRKSGIVPILVRSVQGSATGDADLLGIPRRSSIGPPPIATGLSRSRGDVVPVPAWDDPLINRSNIGKGRPDWDK